MCFPPGNSLSALSLRNVQHHTETSDYVVMAAPEPSYAAEGWGRENLLNPSESVNYLHQPDPFSLPAVYLIVKLDSLSEY